MRDNGPYDKQPANKQVSADNRSVQARTRSTLSSRREGWGSAPVPWPSASSLLEVTDLEQRDVFRMPAAPAMPIAAVDRLPGGELGGVHPTARQSVVYAAPREPIPVDGLARHDERMPRV
jgi:hypothetical protein